MKGINIPLLEGDSFGIMRGLKMPHDILGNPVSGTPGLGAIETN